MGAVIAQSTVTRIAEPGSTHKRCPHCGSDGIILGGYSSTLLGGGDGTEDGNPNHKHWYECVCRTCEQQFHRHTRYGSVWYTRGYHPTHKYGDVLLAGVATCFERFDYPCKCGGLIEREYREMDGVTPLAGEMLRYQNGKKFQRTFWLCRECTFEVETKSEHAR